MSNLAVDNTKKMLDVLNENEISAIQGVAKAFIMDGPFAPKTEEELFQRIDYSIAEADAGKLEEADKAIDDVMAEITNDET